MKKILFVLSAMPFLLASCRKTGDDSYYYASASGDEALSHEEIILGERLEDPYSVENMTKALAGLYPTKAASGTLRATDYYVRFLPSDERQFALLEDLGLEFMDHPLDYRIVRDGDYYHDPDIDDDSITWQYCVVPRDFEFPSGVRYELLDECYIPENDASTKGDIVDWEEVERLSYILTGNADMLELETKASKTSPSGRITIIDDDANGGKPFGLAGVKVVTNSFVKFSSAYTDRDGYYTIPKKYSGNIRYRLMFKNVKGFAIGFNLILVPASMSALGKGPSSGKSVTVSSGSDRKLWCRSVVNNAAYEYYSRCNADDMDISVPPSDLRIWLFYTFSSSSTVMLKQGALIDNSVLTKYFNGFEFIIKLFVPDITLGLKGKSSYADIYSTVCHELAHASHFRVAGKDYWTDYIVYVLKSFIQGKDSYGDGSGSGAGKCSVGEMWAYYLESKMYADRYGGGMPSFGTSWWFRPQILRYLDERGLAPGRIFKALGPEVDSASDLEQSLMALYPAYSFIIGTAFDRYGE